MAKKAGRWWRAGEEAVRSPSTPVTYGRGADPFTDIQNEGLGNRRPNKAGVATPSDINSFFPIAIQGTEETNWFTAWDIYKDFIDDLREAEEAGSYDWTGTITGSNSTAGTLAYRADLGAAAEQWRADTAQLPINTFTQITKRTTTLSTTWTAAVDSAVADGSPVNGGTPVEAGVEGNFFVGTNRYFCQISRLVLKPVGVSSSLVPTVDDVTWGIRWDEYWKDFGRSKDIEVWAASDATWDGAYQVLGTVDGTFIDTNQGQFRSTFTNVTDYYDFDGSTNYFQLRIAGDTTTLSGSGDIDRPPAPTGQDEIEGVRILKGASQNQWHVYVSEVGHDD